MRALLGYSVASWLSAIIGFIAIPIATRSFDQEIIGKLNLLLSCALILQTVVLMGLDQGYLRHFFDLKGSRQKNTLLFFCLAIPVVATLLTSLIVFLFSDFVISFFDASGILICFALVLALSSFVIVRIAICYCRVKGFLPLFILLSVAFTILTKCPYLLNFGNKSLDSTLKIMSAIFICAVILSAAVMLPDIKGFSFHYLRKIDYGAILRYSLPMMPAMLLANLNTYVPQFSIKLFSGYADLGVYSMSATVASVVGLVSAGVNSFWPTYVYEHYDDHHYTVILFHKVLVSALFVLGVVLISLRFMVPWFLGERYEQSATLFAVLIISPICYSIGETSGIGIQIAKRSRFYLFIYSAGLVLNVILATGLTAIFGMIGSAISVAAVAMLMLFLKTSVGNKYYDSIGSFRWSTACVLLLVLQAVSAIMLPYACSVIACIASVVLFPLVVGIQDCRSTLSTVYSYIRK